MKMDKQWEKTTDPPFHTDILSDSQNLSTSAGGNTTDFGLPWLLCLQITVVFPGFFAVMILNIFNCRFTFLRKNLCCSDFALVCYWQWIYCIKMFNFIHGKGVHQIWILTLKLDIEGIRSQFHNVFSTLIKHVLLAVAQNRRLIGALVLLPLGQQTLNWPEPPPPSLKIKVEKTLWNCDSIPNIIEIEFIIPGYLLY